MVARPRPREQPVMRIVIMVLPAVCVGGGFFFRRVSGGCVGLLRVHLFVGKGARVVGRGVKGVILGDGSRVERIIRTGFGL